MSHTKLIYHMVFSTHCRVPSIVEDHEKELYKWLWDFAVKRRAFVRRIGGMPDHVHFLCDLPPTVTVADFIKILKSESSKFMTVNPHFPQWNGWTEGYYANTVDESSVERVRQYIKNQKTHHKNKSFEEELDEFWPDRNDRE